MPARPVFAFLLTAACAAACAQQTDQPAASTPISPPSAAAAEPTGGAPRSGDAAGTSAGQLPDLGTRKAGHDWPQFLGPTADSKSSETGILTTWGSQGPRVVWHERVGAGYGMPSISRGRLYQFDRHGGLARLSCLKSETGEFVWKFEYPTDYEDLYSYDNGPRCSPVVDDDRVYIFGAEGMLHCVRAVDGELVWKMDTAAGFGVIQNFFGVGSTPVVEGDLLIVQVGGSPEESRRVPAGALDLVKPNGSGVVALDKFTGEVKYQVADELASYAGPVLATVDDRRWCFVFARGGLLGLEPASGQVRFHFPWRASMLESVNASNPVVVGNRVFISETYGPGSALLAIEGDGYRVVWSDEQRRRGKSMQTHWNTAIHHDGYLYGSSGRHSENAEVRCIELETGKAMWSEPGLGRSSLLYVDAHLVCLTEFGQLLLLRATPDKFDLVSECEAAPRMLKYPAWAAPILSHGLLYLRGDSRLVCMELIPEKP